TDDPRVVTRLDHVRLSSADVLLSPVFVSDAHRARKDDADMMHLAAIGACYRLDALRPTPAGLQRHPRCARPSHPNDLYRCLVGRTRLVRCREVTHFQASHSKPPCVVTNPDDDPKPMRRRATTPLGGKGPGLAQSWNDA